MGWDPAVLRKYNTTGHFRLLNQVRSELKGNPLIRPKPGETVGAANRSRGLTRAIEIRAQAGPGRSRRAQAAVEVVLAPPELRMEASRSSQTGSSWGTPSDGSTASGGWSPRPESSGPPSDWETASADQLGLDSGSGSFRDRLNAIEMR